jgi:hypothetical protein
MDVEDHAYNHSYSGGRDGRITVHSQLNQKRKKSKIKPGSKSPTGGNTFTVPEMLVSRHLFGWSTLSNRVLLKCTQVVMVRMKDLEGPFLSTHLNPTFDKRAEPGVHATQDCT